MKTESKSFYIENADVRADVKEILGGVGLILMGFGVIWFSCSLIAGGEWWLLLLVGCGILVAGPLLLLMGWGAIKHGIRSFRGRSD